MPDPKTPPTTPRGFSTDDLGSALSEILDHVDAAGWGQAPSVFALVPTAVLAEQAPDVLGDDADSPLTPIEQECPDLDAFLASAIWPDAVVGAAVATEIVVAPPAPGDDGTPRYVASESGSAAGDPDDASEQARLVVGVLRSGKDLALMRLRRQAGEEIETLTHPQLGTELRAALAGTFTPDEPGA
ncbi:PPA1309 family protein [Gordonia sp. GN26]